MLIPMRGSLTFVSIDENPGLVGETVFELTRGMGEEQQPLVAEIDPQYMGGKELCEHYGINPDVGASCVIVEVIKSGGVTYAAIVVPVGYRADLNHFVKQHFNAKRVSLAQLDEVLEMTRMEYGSITPIGLPSSWKILIDSRLAKKDEIIVGSGRRISKLLLPLSTLLSVPGVEVVRDLGAAAA